ncbi:hypothetical protein GZH46_01760, partial [Fragariocoptes setiger]
MCFSPEQVPLIAHICVSRETSSGRDSSLRNFWNKVRELDMWRNVRSRLKHIGRRRLFLLIFIWTCTCLVLFKLALLFAYIDARQTTRPIEMMMTPRQARALRHSQGDSTQSAVTNTRRTSQSWHLSAPSASSSNTTPHKALMGAASSATPTRAISANVNGCQYALPARTELDVSNTYWQRLVTRARSQNPTQSGALSSESPVASGAPMILSSSSASPAAFSSAPISQSAFNQSSIANSTTSAVNGGGGMSSEEKLLPGQTTFHLYAAYYDDRWRQGGASVRILAMIDRVHPTPTQCLL